MKVQEIFQGAFKLISRVLSLKGK